MRDLSLQLIREQALMGLGHVDEARSLLEATRVSMDEIFALESSKTTKWLGFWFDRSYVRIHLREVELLLESLSNDSA